MWTIDSILTERHAKLGLALVEDEEFVEIRRNGGTVERFSAYGTTPKEIAARADAIARDIERAA
jgi:hypothetical protein